MSINLWIVSGRLTRDAEVTPMQSGTHLLKFTVAQSEKVNGKEYSEFIECRWWSKSAEKLVSHLNKGKKITVTGASKTNEWTDKTGVKRKSTYLNVRNADFDWNKDNGPIPDQEPPTGNYMNDMPNFNGDDEVPF